MLPHSGYTRQRGGIVREDQVSRQAVTDTLLQYRRTDRNNYYFNKIPIYEINQTFGIFRGSCHDLGIVRRQRHGSARTAQAWQPLTDRIERRYNEQRHRCRYIQRRDDRRGREKIDVTGQATIYLAGKDALPSNSFTTEMEGSYRFYAAYGPNVSNDITIKAMPEVPELPADPNPASTDFAHRHLVIQHTGTDCGYCPYMMSALAQLAQDSEYSSQYCLAASHSYNTSDPMYSTLSKNIGRLYGTGNYRLHIDGSEQEPRRK